MFSFEEKLNIHIQCLRLSDSRKKKRIVSRACGCKTDSTWVPVVDNKRPLTVVLREGSLSSLKRVPVAYCLHYLLQSRLHSILEVFEWPFPFFDGPQPSSQPFDLEGFESLYSAQSLVLPGQPSDFPSPAFRVKMICHLLSQYTDRPSIIRYCVKAAADRPQEMSMPACFVHSAERHLLLGSGERGQLFQKVSVFEANSAEFDKA